MTYADQPKTRRTFTSEFKAQLIALYHNGKESMTLLDKWIKQAVLILVRK